MGKEVKKIKIIQWNIGGGKIRKESNDAMGAENYKYEGIDYIVDKLKSYNPDIITLQETHANNKFVQAEFLSKKLNLPYFFNDIYDHSHIESAQELGQAIISRFPLNNHSFEFFINPKLKITRLNGEEWTTHNKGISTCVVKINNNFKLYIQTLHLVPFSSFGTKPLSRKLKGIRTSISDKVLKNKSPFILQGDFNYNNDSIKKFLPGIFTQKMKEVRLSNPTTPKGRKYDHVIYRGLRVSSFKIDDNILTDHYLLYAELEIEQIVL